MKINVSGQFHYSGFYAKELFFCILLLCLFRSEPASAQQDYYNYDLRNTDTAEVEWILSGEAGLSIPTGQYARAGLSQPAAGYALRGHYFAFGLDVFSESGLGLFISGNYNENRLREAELAEAIEYINRPAEIRSFQAGSRYELSGFTGIALKVKPANKIEVTARAGAGITSSRRAPVAFNITPENSRELRVNELSHTTQSTSFTGGFTFHYYITGQTSLYLNARYVTGIHRHDDITRRVNLVNTNQQATQMIDDVKRVQVFQIGAGISYRL